MPQLVHSILGAMHDASFLHNQNLVRFVHKNVSIQWDDIWGVEMTRDNIFSWIFWH